jgi:hypothetical protein
METKIEFRGKAEKRMLLPRNNRRNAGLLNDGVGKVRRASSAGTRGRVGLPLADRMELPGE